MPALTGRPMELPGSPSDPLATSRRRRPAPGRASESAAGVRVRVESYTGRLVSAVPVTVLRVSEPERVRSPGLPVAASGLSSRSLASFTPAGADPQPGLRVSLAQS
jgi:hypothetical protein